MPAPWASKLFAVDGKVPTGHDFGSVPRGAQLKHRFPVKNIYAVPLQFTARVSCGCLTVTATPPVLQPREEGFLDVNMDTLKFNGHKSVTVEVTVLNQQFYSTAVFQVVGHCRTDITLEPGQAVFGVVARGQPATRELLVRYAGQLAWQVGGVAPGDAAPFDVKVVEAYRQPGQVGYRVALTLKPDAPAGSLKGDLQLVTNDPASRLLPVPYEVMVQAPLMASQDRVQFGPARAGEPVERRLILSGARPFRIVGVDGEADGLRVEYGPAAAMRQILAIKFQPTQPGPVQRTLTIKTDLDGGASTSVRVEATVQ
jgi:hypothetical protein